MEVEPTTITLDTFEDEYPNEEGIKRRRLYLGTVHACETEVQCDTLGLVLTVRLRTTDRTFDATLFEDEILELGDLLLSDYFSGFPEDFEAYEKVIKPLLEKHRKAEGE